MWTGLLLLKLYSGSGLNSFVVSCNHSNTGWVVLIYRGIFITFHPNSQIIWLTHLRGCMQNNAYNLKWKHLKLQQKSGLKRPQMKENPVVLCMYDG